MRARRVQIEEIQSVKFSEILCVDPPGYEVQIGRKKIGWSWIFSILKVSVKTGGSGGCPPSFFSPAGEIFFSKGYFPYKTVPKKRPTWRDFELTSHPKSNPSWHSRAP